MGRIYGTTTSTRGGRIYGGTSSDLSDEVKESPNLLEKAFGLLTAAETAPGVYAGLTGKDPLKTYGQEFKQGVTLQGMSPEKKTYSDVLELLGMPEYKIAGPVSGRGITGLGLDILLDPTTYIGAGLFKRAFKGGKKLLGLTTKIPKVGPKLKATKELTEDLFVPGARIKRLGEPGEKYWESYLKMTKKGRGEEFDLAESIAKLEKTSKEKGVLGQALSKSVLPRWNT